MRDVALGSGRAVRPADAVYADLIKAYWKTGVVFYVAWGPRRAEWLSMPTQAPGMRRGIVGMRAGGRRTIVMPQSVSDVHAPDDSGWEAAHVDVVVRKVLPAG